MITISKQVGEKKVYCALQICTERLYLCIFNSCLIFERPLLNTAPPLANQLPLNQTQHYIPEPSEPHAPAAFTEFTSTAEEAINCWPFAIRAVVDDEPIACRGHHLASCVSSEVQCRQVAWVKCWGVCRLCVCMCVCVDTVGTLLFNPNRTLFFR